MEKSNIENSFPKVERIVKRLKYSKKLAKIQKHPEKYQKIRKNTKTLKKNTKKYQKIQKNSNLDCVSGLSQAVCWGRKCCPIFCHGRSCTTLPQNQTPCIQPLIIYPGSKSLIFATNDMGNVESTRVWPSPKFEAQDKTLYSLAGLPESCL